MISMESFGVSQLPSGVAVVYALQNGDLVKIGFTKNLRRRLSEYTRHTGSEIRILGWVEGSRELETDLHLRFADYRQHGEWFALPAESLALLRSKLGGSCGVVTMPDFRIPKPKAPIQRTRTNQSGYSEVEKDWIAKKVLDIVTYIHEKHAQ